MAHFRVEMVFCKADNRTVFKKLLIATSRKTSILLQQVMMTLCTGNIRKSKAGTNSVWNYSRQRQESCEVRRIKQIVACLHAKTILRPIRTRGTSCSVALLITCRKIKYLKINFHTWRVFVALEKLSNNNGWDHCILKLKPSK